MADAIGGVWYRNGYVTPIYDALNEDPPVTIVGYLIQKIVIPGGAFTTPFLLPNKEPTANSDGVGSNYWYPTEQDARDAIDRLMLKNDIPDM